MVILFLSVFTVIAVFVCGCNESKTYDHDDNIDAESAQVETVEEEHDSETPNEDCENEKCPDGKCPQPRRPHKRHNKRLPRPKSAYKKRN